MPYPKGNTPGSRFSPSSAKGEKGKPRSRGMHIFISYKHNDRSQGLATFLKDFLKQHGHYVFTDVDIVASEKWPKRLME